MSTISKSDLSTLLTTAGVTDDARIVLTADPYLIPDSLFPSTKLARIGARMLAALSLAAWDSEGPDSPVRGLAWLAAVLSNRGNSEGPYAFGEIVLSDTGVLSNFVAAVIIVSGTPTLQFYSVAITMDGPLPSIELAVSVELTPANAILVRF